MKLLKVLRELGRALSVLAKSGPHPYDLWAFAVCRIKGHRHVELVGNVYCGRCSRRLGPALP